MANEEHLRIIKLGVKVWNKWRLDHPLTTPELDEASFDGLDLRSADFRGAYLAEAKFRRARLDGADFGPSYPVPQPPNLGLSRFSSLSEADFTEADLRRANLSYTILERATLAGAYLRETNFAWANFHKTNLGNAIMDKTIFVDNDLSSVKGLDTITHHGPSSIGFDTVTRSKSDLSEAFLRGCGLSDWQIEARKLNKPELRNEEISDILYRIHHVRAHQSIQVNTLFISYSHKDSSFVDRIEHYLNDKGIRFWRDEYHATAGPLEKQVDKAIRLNPTVLLVLSHNSVKSDWVQHEARLARNLEIELGRHVLCPIALDNTWATCQWPERLREQIQEYKVLDFSDWRIESSLQRMFHKLVEGLQLFYRSQ